MNLKFLEEKDNFMTKTICGKPFYMAPEIFEGTGYSFATDFWSLGVLAFFCITNDYIFRIENVENFAHEIQEKSVDFSNFEFDWPADLEVLIVEVFKLNFNLVLLTFIYSFIKYKWIYVLNTKLLRKDCEHRLKSLRDVVHQDFFKNFDWEELESSRMVLSLKDAKIVTKYHLEHIDSTALEQISNQYNQQVNSGLLEPSIRKEFPTIQSYDYFNPKYF